MLLLKYFVLSGKYYATLHVIKIIIEKKESVES
jgi:hypothetical protein